MSFVKTVKNNPTKFPSNKIFAISPRTRPKVPFKLDRTGYAMTFQRFFKELIHSYRDREMSCCLPKSSNNSPNKINCFPSLFFQMVHPLKRSTSLILTVYPSFQWPTDPPPTNVYNINYRLTVIWPSIVLTKVALCRPRRNSSVRFNTKIIFLLGWLNAHHNSHTRQWFSMNVCRHRQSITLYKCMVVSHQKLEYGNTVELTGCDACAFLFCIRIRSPSTNRIEIFPKKKQALIFIQSFICFKKIMIVLA